MGGTTFLKKTFSIGLLTSREELTVDGKETEKKTLIGT
jgi:hypothetical protein